MLLRGAQIALSTIMVINNKCLFKEVKVLATNIFLGGLGDKGKLQTNIYVMFKICML